MMATSRLHVFVTDASRTTIDSAELRVSASDQVEVRRDEDTGAFVLTGAEPGARVQLVAETGRRRSEVLEVDVRSGDQQIVLGVPQEGELAYRRGDSRLVFRPDPDHYLVLVNGKRASPATAAVLRELHLRATRLSPSTGSARRTDRDGEDADEAVYVVRADADQAAKVAQALRRRRLQVRLVRPIRHRDEEQPQGLTTEIVSSFRGDVTPGEVEQIASDHGLQVMREIHHAGNGYPDARTGNPYSIEGLGFYSKSKETPGEGLQDFSP